MLYKISLMILISLLSACASDKYAAFTQVQNNYRMQTDKPLFLVQEIPGWDLVGLSKHYYFIAPADENNPSSRQFYDNEGEIMDIPSLREYLRNIAIWKREQDKFRTSPYKILGIVPAGTPYKIVYVGNRENPGRMIVLENGAFKGKRGLYEDTAV